VIGVLSNATANSGDAQCGGGEEKQIEEGTLVRPPNSKSDLVAVADPRETQNRTPATTKETSDILTNCRSRF
jgi:hypothetical protein